MHDNVIISIMLCFFKACQFFSGVAAVSLRCSLTTVSTTCHVLVILKLFNIMQHALLCFPLFKAKCKDINSFQSHGIFSRSRSNTVTVCAIQRRCLLSDFFERMHRAFVNNWVLARVRFLFEISRCINKWGFASSWVGWASTPAGRTLGRIGGGSSPPAWYIDLVQEPGHHTQ